MYENNEKFNSTKQVLLSVLAVAILVVTVVGVSFALFNYAQEGNNINTLKTGTLLFNYDNENAGIYKTNSMPMSDPEARQLSGTEATFDFTITPSKASDVPITYLISASETTNPDFNVFDTLESKYIKVMLSKGEAPSQYDEVNPVLPPTYFDQLSDANSVAFPVDPNVSRYVVKQLYTTTLETGAGTQYYRFRMWMSSYDSSGNPTVMTNDVCSIPVEGQEGVTTDGACYIDGDQTQIVPGAEMKTKGTTNKEFSVRINVEALEK